MISNNIAPRKDLSVKIKDEKFHDVAPFDGEFYFSQTFHVSLNLPFPSPHLSHLFLLLRHPRGQI